MTRPLLNLSQHLFTLRAAHLTPQGNLIDRS